MGKKKLQKGHKMQQNKTSSTIKRNKKYGKTILSNRKIFINYKKNQIAPFFGTPIASIYNQIKLNRTSFSRSNAN